MENTIALPKEFHHHSLPKSVLGCLYALALWIIPGIMVGYVWSSTWPLWAKILIPIPMAVIGGYGVLLCGFMGHDGTHFNLHDNKIISCVMGILTTSPTVLYLLMGFTISHWNHHKYTNTDKDPDSQVFSRFKNFFSRLFLARLYSFYVYGRNCFYLALGKPLPYKYNFPLVDNVLRNLARFNILSNLCFACVHAYFFFNFPIYWLGVVYMRGAGVMISGLSPYVEHTATGIGRGQDTRTSIARWWDIVMVGNNYHLEHHLYPTIPFYNLKKVHVFLKKQGYYDIPRHVSYGVLPTYKYTLSWAPYPSGSHS